MKPKKTYALLIGLVAGAIATWFQPYNQLEIFGVDYRIIMAVAALVFAFLYRLFSGAKTYTAGVYIGFGIIAALVLRIVVDLFADSTDHNLWPLELAIFAVIAFPSALIGAYLAETFFWAKRKNMKRK